MKPGQLQVRSSPGLHENVQPVQTYDIDNPLATAKDADYEHVIPRAVKPSFNLASYVNESELLQQMVKVCIFLTF